MRSAESGFVEITVTLEDGTREQYQFNTKPLPAVPRVGNYGPKTTEWVRTIVFKSQQGLYAQIEGFDICAVCKTISYEIIRISTSNDAEIVTNEGGKYEPEARALIDQAQPGNRYIFTKIRYRCPGALVDQVGETLSFELK
ncbi:GldM family protein [Neolewinella aurantiaca]|uniref:GldM family protein n=1 Tax=Neolewinella aurantiaca TaxID=2602767 RepID=UPI00164F2145|nr:GldM family protein [Neolewinella aurantiaca]